MSQQRQKNYYFLSIRNEKSENFEFIDEFYSTLEEALQAAERLSEFEADGYDRLKIIASGLSKESAEHLTNLKNAISSAANDSDGFTYIFDTREEVINLIREELEDEAAWDLDNDWDLEIIKKLRLAIA